jgi:hypothetical protein
VYSPFLWLSNGGGLSAQNSQNSATKNAHTPVFLPSNNEAMNSETALKELLSKSYTVSTHIMHKTRLKSLSVI